MFKGWKIAGHVTKAAIWNLSISQIPVTIDRTGVEGGLSAPIIFDLIAEDINVVGPLEDTEALIITLQTALSFLVDLEQREIKAFGPQPDPIASTKDLMMGCLYVVN
jgi:hypothetical protein